ncbi:MAG: hypothetical protein JO041_04955 [Acidobacteria bacterium]|nr:hypothetical protein [Acidobacteriota bacterium]
MAISTSIPIIFEPASAPAPRARLRFNVERPLCIALLLSSMGMVGALTGATHRAATPEAEMRLPSIVTEGVLNLLGMLLVVMRWRRVVRAGRAAWPLVALTAFALFSSAWSVHPLLTLRRAALLLVSTAIACYMGERYSVEEFASLAARALCVFMLLTVFCRLVAPSYVVDEFGSWKGLSGYKNAFGEHMAVAVLLLLLVRFRSNWPRYFFLLLAVALLGLSRSVSSLLLCAAMIAVLPVLHFSRSPLPRRSLTYGISTAAVAAAAWWGATHWPMLFQALGRDPTLSGRTLLWLLVTPAVLRHPMLGYGYGSAFWAGLQGEALNIWTQSRWLAPRADNGYLDLCLDVGLVGASLLLFLWARALRRAIAFREFHEGAIALWPLAYLSFFALHGISESTLLSSGDLPFFVFSVLSISLMFRHPRTAPAHARFARHSGVPVSSR